MNNCSGADILAEYTKYNIDHAGDMDDADDIDDVYDIEMLKKEDGNIQTSNECNVNAKL